MFRFSVKKDVMNRPVDQQRYTCRMHDTMYNIFTFSLPSIMLENSLFPFFSGTSLLKRALKRKYTIHKLKLPFYLCADISVSVSPSGSKDVIVKPWLHSLLMISCFTNCPPPTMYITGY